MLKLATLEGFLATAFLAGKLDGYWQLGTLELQRQESESNGVLFVRSTEQTQIIVLLFQKSFETLVFKNGERKQGMRHKIDDLETNESPAEWAINIPDVNLSTLHLWVNGQLRRKSEKPFFPWKNQRQTNSLHQLLGAEKSPLRPEPP